MINCFIFVLWQLVFWLCNGYSRRILALSSGISVVETLFNLLYFVVFFLFFILVFHKNKTPFSKDLSSSWKTFARKFHIKRILILIGVQIGLDGIRFLGMTPAGIYGDYLVDFLTVTQWLLLYLICVKPENNLFKSRKAAVAIIGVLAVLFAVAAFLNAAVIREFTALTDKYELTAERASIGITNLTFVLSLKTSLLDTVVGLAFIIAHGVCNQCLFEKEERKFIKSGIRGFVVLIVALVFAFIKTVSFPYNSFKITNLADETSFAMSDKFYADTEITEVQRLDKTRQFKTVFLSTNDRLFYNDELIKSFSSNDGKQSESYEQNGNQMVIQDRFDEYEIEGTPVFVYKNQAICFIENGDPKVILFDEISRQPQNDMLIGICEELLLRGNIEIFEYSYIYLQQHDAIFIEDFVDRYKNGEFTDDEIDRLKEMGIKQSYLPLLLRDKGT